VLFNGTNLNGWETWLGPKFTSGFDQDTVPIGLNVDPENVFSVVEEDGAPAIRISGQHFGGINTIESFENYHLSLDFKWGEQKWPPRDSSKRDSGLLYHAVGPQGADWGFWMRSQELQIQEGDVGDYWGVAGAAFDIPSLMTIDSNYVYAPEGEIRTFNYEEPNGRHCIKSKDGENPSFEWNTVELYCSADTAVHIINGVTNMVLYQSAQLENGISKPLIGGKLQIQSEGAEVYYRNIKIRPITFLPSEILP